MKLIQVLLPLALLGALPLLGGCDSGQSPAKGSTAALTAAIDSVQAKLESQPLVVSHDTPGKPKAEIAVNGDFLVDGKTVTVTPEQRKALLAYRQQVLDIGKQGAVIGKQGAILGANVAGQAISGALAGKSEQEVRQDVEQQTAAIRKAAAGICERMSGLLSSQQALVAALPAFQPYAGMTQQDIDDCRNNALKDEPMR